MSCAAAARFNDEVTRSPGKAADERAMLELIMQEQFVEGFPTWTEWTLQSLISHLPTEQK